MNVRVVQSVLSSFQSVWSTSMTTRSSTGSSLGAAAYYTPSSSPSNAYSANDYSNLAFSAVTLNTASVIDSVASQFALSAASTRESEAKAEVIEAAETALSEGDLDKARNIAQGMLDEDGRDAVGAHLMARTYMEEQNYDEAEQWFSRAAIFAPSSDRFQSDLMTARLLKEDDADVLEAAGRMIRRPSQRTSGMRLLGYLADRSPDNVEAHTMLGDAMWSEGMTVEAIASYKNALVSAEESELEPLVGRFRGLIDVAPDVGVTHSLLGQALQRQGDYDEAMTELTTASRLAPDNESYAQAIGVLYGDMGFAALEERRTSDALRYFEEANGRDPSNTAVKGGLARAHMQMADWWQSRGIESKAYDELSSAQLFAPDEDEDLQADLAAAFDRVGDRFKDEGNLDYAISAYKRAYELDDSKYGHKFQLAEAYDEKGTVLFDLSEFESAEMYYQDAVDLFPTRQSYLDHLQAAQDAQA